MQWSRGPVSEKRLSSHVQPLSWYSSLTGACNHTRTPPYGRGLIPNSYMDDSSRKIAPGSVTKREEVGIGIHRNINWDYLSGVRARRLRAGHLKYHKNQLYFDMTQTHRRLRDVFFCYLFVRRCRKERSWLKAWTMRSRVATSTCRR